MTTDPNTGTADLSSLIGQKVRVHVNLQQKNLTITQKGKRVASCDHIELADAHMVIYENTRKTITQTHRRRVHAWIEGTVVAINRQVPEGAIAVSYNPHADRAECSGAFRTAEGVEVWNAASIHIANKRAWILPEHLSTDATDDDDECQATLWEDNPSGSTSDTHERK